MENTVHSHYCSSLMLFVFLTRHRTSFSLSQIPKNSGLKHRCDCLFYSVVNSLEMQLLGSNSGGGARQLGSATTLAASASLSSAAGLNNVGGGASSSNKPILRGVVFDMDGTLTIPNLDFGEMYARCNVPKNEDILTAIANMPTEEAKRAKEIVEEMEEEGRRTLRLMPGAVELGSWLTEHEVPFALVTRNNKKTVQHFVDNLWNNDDTGVGTFSVILSRDDPADMPHKPDPAALKHIAEKWDIEIPSNALIMVGDSPSNDIVFGKAAGVSTALLDSEQKYTEDSNKGEEAVADICMKNLLELPCELWKKFHIESSLGTNKPLLKYPPPKPRGTISKAAIEGDLNQLETLSLKEINTPDNESGNTPLIWASDAGQLEAVALLIGKGADMNIRGYLGATAICRASRRGHVEILKLLLQHKANPNIPNDKMQYPLHFAAFKLNKDAVDILLKHGTNTLVLDRKGRTPAEDTSDASIREMIINSRSNIHGLS